MKVDFSKVDLKDIDKFEERALEAFDTLMNRDGEGNDFLGWIDRPVDYDKDEFERIKKAGRPDDGSPCFHCCISVANRKPDGWLFMLISSRCAYFTVCLLHGDEEVVFLSFLQEEVLPVYEVFRRNLLVESRELLLVEAYAAAFDQLAHLAL